MQTNRQTFGWAVCAGVLFGLIGWIGGVGTEEFFDLQAREQEQSEMVIREKVAAQMIRYGAVDWSMICAYTMGQRRASRDDMLRACSVDYRLGLTPAQEARRR
jgi:hypothetical protein